MGKWTRETIVAAIQRLAWEDADLAYAAVTVEHVALFRAAVRVYGSWRAALEHAGFPDGAWRRRRKWTQESVLAQIRELQARGCSLAWSDIAKYHPALGAAAVRRSRFGSWKAALQAAGIDERSVRRLRRWDGAQIVAGILERRRRGEGLNAGAVERSDPSLISAARRTYGSWNRALEAAGIEPSQVVQRRRRGVSVSQDRKEMPVG
jgi:hypothetical protein